MPIHERYDPENPDTIPAREMTFITLAIVLAAPRRPEKCDRILREVTHPFARDVIRLIFGRKPTTRRARAARAYVKSLKKIYPWLQC